MDSQNNQSWSEFISSFLNKFQPTKEKPIIDDSYSSAQKNNRKYILLTPEGHKNFLIINNEGTNYISIIRTFPWNLQNNKRYWTKENIRNSYDDEGTYRLNFSGWVKLHFSFFHIKKGNYKLFLNQDFDNIKVSRIGGQLILKVFINDKEILKIINYPFDEIEKLSDIDTVFLHEDPLCYIDEDQFNNIEVNKNTNDYTIKVEFIHKDLRLKDGWFIDGGKLLEIKKEIIDNEKKNKNIKYPFLYKLNNDNIITTEDENFTNLKDKEYKFFKLINRKYKECIFSKKLKRNLTQYLFDFFDEKELFEISKINIFFHNNLCEYDNNKDKFYWPIYLLKFTKDYNCKTDYSNKNFDLTYKDSQRKARKFEFPEKTKNIYQITYEGESYLSIARTFDWAYKKSEDHWTEDNIPKSYDGGNVPKLKSVCWLETKFDFLHVKPGNYKVFIHEAFTRNWLDYTQLTITIIINDKEVLKAPFPKKKFIEKKGEKLKEDLVYVICKKEFDQIEADSRGDYVIQIQFFHAEGSWKSGWLIDGGKLLKIKTGKGEEEDEKIAEDLKKKIIEEK